MDKVICPTCDGAGIIQTERPAFSAEAYGPEIVCGSCGGHGEVSPEWADTIQRVTHKAVRA